MENDDLDRFISGILKKNELEIPSELQGKLRGRVSDLAQHGRRSAWDRFEIWVPLLAAALLLLVVSLPLLVPPQPATKKISQIRTEFSIPDKNIRILWVQREDFHLPDTNG